MRSGSCAGTLFSRPLTVSVVVGQSFSVVVAHERSGRLDFPVAVARGSSVRRVGRTGARVTYLARSLGTTLLVASHTRFCASARGRVGSCTVLVVRVSLAKPIAGALYVGYPLAKDPFELRVSSDRRVATIAAPFYLIPSCANAGNLNPTSQNWPAIPIGQDGTFSAHVTIGDIGINTAYESLVGVFDGSHAYARFTYTLACGPQVQNPFIHPVLGENTFTDEFTLAAVPGSSASSSATRFRAPR